MTPAIKRSLAIIKSAGTVTPKQFAVLYFPKDHEGWSRSGKAGFGATRGQGLVLWAGAG